jgi:hypothetical protein
MLTAVAIDDEPSALQVVQLHAAKVLFLELKASFTNAFEALHYLQQHPVDLLFPRREDARHFGLPNW